jgi:hypothetical protein
MMKYIFYWGLRTLFQSSKKRVTADDNHICINCINEKECTVKPEPEQWRFVLTYCQRFIQDNFESSISQ